MFNVEMYTYHIIFGSIKKSIGVFTIDVSFLFTFLKKSPSNARNKNLTF